MKAMILAAGLGQRMQPLTLHTPKPLLKVAGKHLIEYTIEALVAVGITEIIINYSHLGEQFPKALGNGDKYGATIKYSPENEGPLETAGGIINALPLLGEEPFIIVNGDIWCDYPFIELIENQQERDASLCHLVLVDNPAHNKLGDFAINNGFLSEQGNNKFTYSGIGLYHPQLFSGFGVQAMPLKPLLQKAISSNKATGEIYGGDWSDIGTVERLNELSAQLSY
jgi:MurNAc alpha-1-phosphate uridylyltransferase